MRLARLLLRNLRGNAFRSGAIFLAAALVAGLALAATLVVRGAEEQLAHSLERLGADIIAIPWGTMRTKELQGARLLSMATKQWMPRAYVSQIAAVEGVDRVTAQLYITTLEHPAFSTRPEVHVIAYDPVTDFAIKPWLEDRDLTIGKDQAIGGSLIYAPNLENTLDVLGYELQLAGNLKPTGGELDQVLLISFETAHEIIEAANRSDRPNGLGLYLAPDSVSAVLVQVDLDGDPHEVAIRILEQVRSVLPIESTGLFQTERAQMVGLLRTALLILAVIWALSIVFVGLMFSMAVSDRRREIGVLRALGAPQRFIFGTLLAESAVLALGGGTLGSALTIIGATAGRGELVHAIGLPFALPPTLHLIALALAGMALALVSVVLAASVPAIHISRQEVALVMRE